MDRSSWTSFADAGQLTDFTKKSWFGDGISGLHTDFTSKPHRTAKAEDLQKTQISDTQTVGHIASLDLTFQLFVLCMYRGVYELCFSYLLLTVLTPAKCIQLLYSSTTDVSNVYCTALT